LIDKSGVSTGCNSGKLACQANGGGDFVLLLHMDTACSTKNVKPTFLEDRITSDGTTILGADGRLGVSAILLP